MRTEQNEAGRAGGFKGIVVTGLLALALIGVLVFWLIPRNTPPEAPGNPWGPERIEVFRTPGGTAIRHLPKNAGGSSVAVHPVNHPSRKKSPAAS